MRVDYLSTLEKMLDYTFFDVLCHFDLVKKFGRLPSNTFDDQFFTVLRKVKARRRLTNTPDIFKHQTRYLKGSPT